MAFFIFLLEFFYSLVLLGSIGSKPVSGEVRFNSTYGGQEVIGRVGLSQTFAWTFTGDVQSIDWGTKSSVGNAIDDTLVSLTTSGPGSAVPPSQYTGRVNGIWDGKSPGHVTFTLNSIRKDDENAYVCQITPESLLGLSAVDTVRLVVKDPARASLLQQVIVGDMGDTVTFTCNATGIPTPIITWMRRQGNNETVVVRSSSKYDITSGSATSSLLTIKNIDTADYGYYECKATGEGFDVASGFLGVPYLNASQGSARVSSTKATVGNLVTLDCPVIGFPQPEITWTLPNGSVMPNRLVSTLPVILETDADFGNYTCNAKSLDRTIPPLIISIQESVLLLKSKVKNGTPAVVNWDAVSNAEYYLVKITGDSIEDDVHIASGNKDSNEIHFNTLVLKGNKEVKEVHITVQVLALNRDDGVFARGKRLTATVSASVALQATILHLCVVLVQMLSG